MNCMHVVSSFELPRIASHIIHVFTCRLIVPILVIDVRYIVSAFFYAYIIAVYNYYDIS